MIHDIGFTKIEKEVPVVQLLSLIEMCPAWDIPQRGHDRKGNYYDRPTPNVDWSNYWGVDLTENYHVTQIRKRLDEIAGTLLDDAYFYGSDVSVLAPGSSLIRPHVDTPHRHPPWNHSPDRRLGIQMSVPLNEWYDGMGGTAFLAHSHRKTWPIEECYKGTYNEMFKEKSQTIHLEFGDIAVWDARTLHSQMINHQTTKRYVLLLNYVEGDIVDELVAYESSLHDG